MKLVKYFYHSILFSHHVKKKDFFNMKDYPTVMKYHFEKSKYHHERYLENIPSILKMKDVD